MEVWVRKLVSYFLKYWKVLAVLTVLYNLFLSSWLAINGDLLFQTDLARDFLLLREIEERKFVLIGPRAGAAGLFHGPLWMYINYPIYFLFNGNPVANAWFWIVILALFYVSSFLIAKKLFNSTVAFL